MADTKWGPVGPTGGLTRNHWAGDLATIDIHLEEYEGLVDGRFQYQALFTEFTTERSTAPNTQTYRIDRMKSGKVKGRKSGQALEATRVINDKMLIVVDTVLYTRNVIDYQDDWTSPDRIADISEDNGSEFAELYDNAHIIQAIKARNWVAPTDLKPAFKDGIEVAVTLKANATTQADLEANAVIINLAHRDCVNELIRRKIPLGDMVTLVDTTLYTQLLEHPKLLNIDYGVTNADGYKQRRVVMLNGLPIVEFLEFPTVDSVGQEHPLGDAFKVTAEDAKCRMVTLSKSMSLITIHAKQLTSDFWQDKDNFCMVLDIFTMYNIGCRRPDTIASVSVTEV